MTPTRYLPLAAAAAVFVLLLAGWGAEAGADNDDCDVAQTAFSDCTAYVTGTEDKVSPRCCRALGDIRKLATTAAKRRAICTCILSEMLAAGKVNSGRAAGLPAACSVQIGFIPTRPDFECSSFLEQINTHGLMKHEDTTVKAKSR